MVFCNGNIVKIYKTCVLGTQKDDDVDDDENDATGNGYDVMRFPRKKAKYKARIIKSICNKTQPFWSERALDVSSNIE